MTAPTPGQAAYETVYGDVGLGGMWHVLEPFQRERWEAAAKAAIAVAWVPSLVINFDEEVTEERAAEIRQALDAAVKNLKPRPAPELAAAMRESRLYREGIAKLVDELKTSAAATHPSKKSQIEFELIRKLQAILAGQR